MKSSDHIDDKIFDITGQSWRPIYNAIELLPEQDLADLALNLVRISSIKSKYSLDSEFNATVGGPTNVAIISKVDGFRWYKQNGELS